MANIKKKFNLGVGRKSSAKIQQSLTNKSSLFSLGKTSPVNHNYSQNHRHRDANDPNSRFIITENTTLQGQEGYSTGRFFDKEIDGVVASDQLDVLSGQLADAYNSGYLTGGTFGGITANKKRTQKALSLKIKNNKVKGSLFGGSRKDVTPAEIYNMTSPENMEQVVIPETQLNPQQVRQMIIDGKGYVTLSDGMFVPGTGETLDPNAQILSREGYGRSSDDPRAQQFYQQTTGGSTVSRYINVDTPEGQNFYTDEGYILNEPSMVQTSSSNTKMSRQEMLRLRKEKIKEKREQEKIKNAQLRKEAQARLLERQRNRRNR